MKKVLITAILGAITGSVWSSPMTDANELKETVHSHVTESLFNSKEQGFLWLPSVTILIDDIDAAIDRNDIDSAKLLLATLRAFRPSSDQLRLVLDKESYNTKTLPVLRKYNYKFGTASRYGGKTNPARPFPADKEL